MKFLSSVPVWLLQLLVVVEFRLGMHAEAVLFAFPKWAGQEQGKRTVSSGPQDAAGCPLMDVRPQLDPRHETCVLALG